MNWKDVTILKGCHTLSLPHTSFHFTHTFSHYSYTTLHYTLHPYILHLSNTYIYTLLTTQPLIKSTHKNPYEFHYSNTQTTPIPSSSSFSLPKQQKFFLFPLHKTLTKSNPFTLPSSLVYFSIFISYYLHIFSLTHFNQERKTLWGRQEHLYPRDHTLKNHHKKRGKFEQNLQD